MDKLSLYEYSPLPMGSIRLLGKDDSAGSSIWSLTHHVLSNAPTFFALSYVWGTGKPTERLDIDQSVLTITPSLSTLLHQLETRSDVHFIWIDQICINQQDDVEKAVQVKMMRDVYVSAHKVLVWLGPSTEGSDLAMDSIPPLGESIAKNRFAQDPLPSCLPGRDDPFWPALEDLYKRPWYDRLWVLQEVILAKDIDVLCGNRSMPWAAFASFAIKMRELLPSSLINRFDVRPHDCSAKARDPGFMSIRDMDAMRSNEVMGLKTPFSTYLSIGQKRKVTNPLDRVYGLLGLLASEELVRCIDNRYDWEPWQGYLHFCKIYIERDPELALLSMAGCVSKPKELPSWCPNFDSPPNVISFYCTYSGLSAGFKPGGPRHSQIKSSATSNTITVPGFRMDRVKTVTKALNPTINNTTPLTGSTDVAKEYLQYHLECLKLLFYSAVTTDRQTFCRSLVAGHLAPSEPLPPIDFSPVQIRLLERSLIMTSGGPPPAASAEEYVFLHKWLLAMGAQIFRRFFITENGRMGIGNGNVEKGDHVCVFYSGGPLYLLRYMDADASAELIGDAYVDGLMDLEKMPGDTRGEDEVFVIR